MGTFFHKDKRPKAKAGTKGDDKKTKGDGKRPNVKRVRAKGQGPKAKAKDQERKKIVKGHP